MKLSVIIVNYKVECFLLQTLSSVRAAAQQTESVFGKDSVEIFVVDNDSQDNSVKSVSEFFPEVKLIANTENVGFAKGNNRALKLARGQYKLLLNPDTLIPEDTFIKIVKYADTHPKTGAIGVRMTDTHGEFAPESKRSVPRPMSAFFKIFGFAKLFPKSKRFNSYKLTYLPEFEINEIEAVSGAFMFVRTDALEKAGFLDEAFFMYGEDLDLSYRILKAGYKNVYFPKISIIHYKGESSKQNTKRYADVFYDAMIIFARKHYSKIQFALYKPAILLVKAVQKRSLKKALYLPEKQYDKTFFISSEEIVFQQFKEKHQRQKAEFIPKQNFQDIKSSLPFESELIFAVPDIEFATIISETADFASVRSWLTVKNCLI